MGRLALAGDLVAARIAERALHELLGDDALGEGAAIVDLGEERTKRGS